MRDDDENSRGPLGIPLSGDEGGCERRFLFGRKDDGTSHDPGDESIAQVVGQRYEDLREHMRRKAANAIDALDEMIAKCG